MRPPPLTLLTQSQTCRQTTSSRTLSTTLHPTTPTPPQVLFLQESRNGSLPRPLRPPHWCHHIPRGRHSLRLCMTRSRVRRRRWRRPNHNPQASLPTAPAVRRRGLLRAHRAKPSQQVLPQHVLRLPVRRWCLLGHHRQTPKRSRRRRRWRRRSPLKGPSSSNRKMASAMCASRESPNSTSLCWMMKAWRWRRHGESTRIQLSPMRGRHRTIWPCRMGGRPAALI